MATEGVPLLDRVRSALDDIDLLGVASLEAVQGTPLATSTQKLLPGTRTILVFAKEIFDEVARLVVPEKAMGDAAARDLYGPHVDYVNGRLTRGLYDAARVIRGQGFRALPLPASGTPVDGRFLKGIVCFKHAAEAAGLGRVGRSSLLITDAFGPRVRLACLLTNAEMPATLPSRAKPCAGCTVCAKHCPAGAISVPPAGQPCAIDRFACSQYVNASGGCANCVSMCPIGAR